MTTPRNPAPAGRPGVRAQLPELLVGLLIGLAGGLVLGPLFRDSGLAEVVAPAAPVVSAAEVGDRPVRTQAEFDALVRGKSGPQVVEAVGRPNKVVGDPGRPEAMLYFAATRRDAATPVDDTAVVRFQAGTAIGASFVAAIPTPTP